MKLNEQVAMDLQNDVEAFLFIVTRSATQEINDDILEQFKEFAFADCVNWPTLILRYYRRVQSIQVAIQGSSNTFFNVDEMTVAVTRLRWKLDSAVQLIQVRSMNWRTAVH
jgi:hypothetical protein